MDNTLSKLENTQPTEQQAARQQDIIDQVRDGNYEPQLSVLEQEYMAKAMIRQKEGVVKPQVVAGREFKGTSFISKPEAIVFKDFDVGVSHTQTILFTNVSFSFNSFKLLPLDDNIKDFFHIQYTPTGRMSAGLSTTITITFTPQLNQDINSFFPILSETGTIKIPLICICKKALLSVEDPSIEFGNVIFGEQQTRYLKLNNSGALPTKIYVKTSDGRTIPFFSMDDLRKREQLERDDKDALVRYAAEEAQRAKDKEEAAAKALEEGADEPVDAPAAAEVEGEEGAEPSASEQRPPTAKAVPLTAEEQEFEEFLAQVSFKRTTEIEGYSEAKIQLTFVPYKLTSVAQDFTLFFENQDYTEPIPISIRGQCVDVPIYVEREEYNLNVLVYEQFYRQRIILHNRSQNSMKIQLFFPKDLKPYLEFNPTLGYIQGNSQFEIWLKFRPDRTILTSCAKYLVRKNAEAPPKDEFEEFTMKIPIKVTGANQVLPVKFSILCCFSVSAVTFTPPQIDFGTVFNQSAARATLELENHSLLPQQFSFVRLPKEISVTTDAGTGNLLPGEKYKLHVEYRPSQLQVQEESVIYCRMITGKIQARELKLGYSVNVSKCPLSGDKQKMEFPALPEAEFAEVVLTLTNQSQKSYIIELVPPNPKLSGLMVNPLVQSLAAGKSTLVSVKYTSKFRDLTHQILSNVDRPEGAANEGPAPGMVTRNKKLAERLAARKQGAADAAVADPKKKAAPPAKVEPPKKDAKGAKGGPSVEEEQAEAEKLRLEAEEAEQRRLDEIESNFDRPGELRRLGGEVTDFDVDDEHKRTQHYDWLIPVYYKNADRADAELGCMYLQARTTTVKRSLIPNVAEMSFGEIPVAFKTTKEILVKNVGLTEETMRMEPLTPFGGFSVLNAMRTIKPGETKPIVVQFEPLAQQIYEERVVIYSDTTMVSVNLKGTGVRPEVTITPEEGLLSFANVLVGETADKSFQITNVSSFPVNFELVSQVQGVENQSKQKPFLYMPSAGTVEANGTYDVKILYQPDHHSNDYFDVVLIDIPNQINAKKMYLRGWAYNRQFFARELDPFVWQPAEQLRKKYEEPLQMLLSQKGASPASGTPARQKIFLEFARDEDMEGVEDEFERSKNRKRAILIGNCRLEDQKMEKAGNYEISPPANADKYFDCDVPKGTVQGGQDATITFSFSPPQTDELLKNITALKGIGQWVESVWELKLIGGYTEPGSPDPVIADVVLRAYVEQI